ncbi:MAG: isoleucine--tRNA ligase [bacterium]|nr:isoleucine--tRNA ligase [bacterium]
MDYKSTLNLPKTEFPMKANLPQKEPIILEQWRKMKIYHQLRQLRSGNPKYVLHDGPPYANGEVHLGTAFNKVLKDIIVKSKSMQGFDSPYVPGWDCHGMPIEHQVIKNLRKEKKQVSQVELRQLCRKYAAKYQAIQSEQFQRLGVLGDWDNPYLTMVPHYEAKIVEIFIQLAKKGYIYRGLKPIHWCTECKTALAEAEVEYSDHTSPSIYVKFKLKSVPWHPGDELARHIGKEPVYVIIWTTTPWTLPANVAIAFNPNEEYAVVRAKGENYIIAKALVETAMQSMHIKDYGILGTISGNKFERLKAEHPLHQGDSLCVLADYVKMDTGTGCVHTAPGHGQEDYITGEKYGLPILSPVDDSGVFTKEAGQWHGQKVFAANKLIIECLKRQGLLLYSDTISHAYPHCWRCKHPLIFRATRQWFFDVDKHNLRTRALSEIDRVRWIPEWGHDKIHNLVAGRPDWCLSRQRAWGVPIPALYCEHCAHGWLPLEHIDTLLSLIDKEGVDVWFSKEIEDLFPNGVQCPKCNSKKLKKETDILDVWFDSGVSWAAVLQERPQLGFPCEIYLEAGDQHRGWFQVSLLPAVALENQAPYHICITHGLILDAEGKKMSKSAGNVISPQELIDQYGADVIRLWFASGDYTTDIYLSNEILTPLVEAYRKIRNTMRFILGNLYDFNPDKNAVTYHQLLAIDHWALHQLQKLIAECTDGYNQFEFHRVYQALYTFCTVEMSAFYLDILKDRLYTSKSESIERRAAQTVLYEIGLAMVKLMAPILSYTAEEIWPFLKQKEPSVHLTTMPTVNQMYLNQDLEREWAGLIQIRTEVAKALEVARKEKQIGHSLDAKVKLSVADKTLIQLLTKYEEHLASIFIVSQVTLDVKERLPADRMIEVQVAPADGKKCDRCWNYSVTVGENKAHPTVCARCAQVITG